MVLPENIKFVGHYAFEHARFNSLGEIPDSLNKIGSYAFRKYPLDLDKSLDLNNIDMVGREAFKASSFDKVINKNKINIVNDSFFKEEFYHGKKMPSLVGLSDRGIMMSDGSYYTGGN